MLYGNCKKLNKLLVANLLNFPNCCTTKVFTVCMYYVYVRNIFIQEIIEKYKYKVLTPQILRTLSLVVSQVAVSSNSLS